MDTSITKDVSVADLFDKFIEASTMRNVLSIHHKILSLANLKPCEFNAFFPRYKRFVTTNKRKNWKAKALFSRIDKKAAHKCYSNTKSSTLSTNRNCVSSSNNDGSDEKANCYSNNNALQSYNCLIIGSGPAGLRTAIELQLLGANKVCIVEKRSRFSRNNVLHLWPFVIDDLKSLGAKKFYGKFCAGSIDHISIRQLQLILLKVSLMVGCDFRDSCSYLCLCPDSIKQSNPSRLDITSDKINDTSGDSNISCNINCEKTSSDKLMARAVVGSAESESAAPLGNISDRANSSVDGDLAVSSDRTGNCDSSSDDGKKTTDIEHTSKRPDNLRGAIAHFECDHKVHEKELHSYEWDVIIGADGRRNTLSKFFPRKEFRGRLAIAITANFINRQTQSETAVPEISGLSFIYNQDMFNALAYDTNIQLENICYYKDDTHYFVMTAKKRSLLERGVLINDHATTQDLLSESNVNKEALLKYARDAAYWTTGLEPLDFALNHYGQEDCAMFDFTSMYAATNACKALRTKNGGFSLVGLVGDSLLEPFWPTGSGCARGFLSSFDAAWMCRQWAVNKCAVINYHGSASSRVLARSGGRESACDNAKMVLSPCTYDRMALSVMAERESIYRILAQTTSENLQQNYSHWTLNPHTRYPNLNRHLVGPSQVEHLISDGQLRVNLVDTGLYKAMKMSQASHTRRVKSPNSSGLRKSPKKLKSAGASPMAMPKNIKNRSKSLSKYYESRGHQDLELVDSYIEFEESYRSLADSETRGSTQYLSHKRRDYSEDDILVPSISGTLPSSNNLTFLEARRARDIDDCLKQRRQKTKINFVRDQLINQLRGHTNLDNKNQIFSGGNAVLFNEIKRMREQQSTSGPWGESKPRDIGGPLTILKSMRRCASFAERVKNFENKMVQPNHDNLSSESNASTPKTPIDNVKNLPQFATLQDLIVNNTATKSSDAPKSRIPVTKLTKEDWNVKCWEERLRNSKDHNDVVSASRSNFSKSSSVEMTRYEAKSRKQVDVFQDRIKQMADKLKTSGVKDQKPSRSINKDYTGVPAPVGSSNKSVRSQGWINHLKRELVKGAISSNHKSRQQPMNPVMPSKPIKKLFEDDGDDDDEDMVVNKHYDHLCINRPTNKYLSKGAYTSHLARNKLGNATSRVINRPSPSFESKQAYMSALKSRGSSASSTMSDYSTNTGNSNNSSSSSYQPNNNLVCSAGIVDVDCARCKKFVSTSDRITIGQSSLHRVCLTCASCQLTLRTNEIQLYLDPSRANKADSNFLCAICKPEIRTELNRAANYSLDDPDGEEQLSSMKTSCIKSREDFLNSSINYGELYKNILIANGQQKQPQDKKLDSEPKKSKASPSPLNVTLTMRENENGDEIYHETHIRAVSAGIIESASRPSFRVANRETVNGNELVTLILPPSTTPGDDGDMHKPVESQDSDDDSQQRCESSLRKGAEQQHELIDEEELNRILHLDKAISSSKSSRRSSDDSSTSRLSASSDDENLENSEASPSSASSSQADKSAESKYSEPSEDRKRQQNRLSDEDSSSLEAPSESGDDNFGDDDHNDRSKLNVA